MTRTEKVIVILNWQVAPHELESLLLEHPLIADAAVIGIEDERSGERPKAFVVKRAGGEAYVGNLILVISSQNQKAAPQFQLDLFCPLLQSSLFT